MAKTDVWFETPPFRDDYQLVEVDGSFMAASVKPKQFLHIDQAECILCEGCVDICPWKCIHYLSVESVTEAVGTADPNSDGLAVGMFVVDEDECTRCALCIDRCPTGVITLGKFEGSLAATAEVADLPPWHTDSGQRDFKNGYSYGMRW
ncbi:MAG: 4Fe-4S dicluster domain-containing protein [Acidimicrobiia bacterium]